MHFITIGTRFLSRVLTRIAAMALPNVLVLTLLPGLALCLLGIAIEIGGHSHLLTNGGKSALNGYLEAMQTDPVDSLSDYLHFGMRGQLPSFGGNLQAAGVLVAYLGSLLLAIAVLTARSFTKIPVAIGITAKTSCRRTIDTSPEVQRPSPFGRGPWQFVEGPARGYLAGPDGIIVPVTPTRLDLSTPAITDDERVRACNLALYLNHSGIVADMEPAACIDRLRSISAQHGICLQS